MVQVTRQMIVVFHEICLDGGVLQQPLQQDLDTRFIPVDVKLGTTCDPILATVIWYESSLHDAITVRLHHGDVVVVISGSLQLVEEFIPDPDLTPRQVESHLLNIRFGDTLALLCLLGLVDPATP